MIQHHPFAFVTSHVRRIKIIKMLAIAIFAVMLFLLIFIPYSNKTGNKDSIILEKNSGTINSQQKDKPNLLTILKPKFQAIDQNNLPYYINADEAIQIDKDNVILTNIDADIQKAEGGNYFIKSLNGTINQLKKEVQLSGKVHIIDETGLVIDTETLIMDIDLGSIYSTTPISLKNPQMTLTADKFELDRKTSHLTFTGNVKMVMDR